MAITPAGDVEPEKVLTMDVRELVSKSGIALWISGMIISSIWFMAANIRFYIRLCRDREYMNEFEGVCRCPVYLSENIETPCVYGFFNPKIYVTPEVLKNEKVLKHVLAHETTHYRHGDNIWCVLRIVAVVIHWYNPLVWLAAVLSREDSELACDESTIKRIGEGERIEYGRTLVGLTCRKFNTLLVSATTMSGTKRSIKERIVLITKKPETALYTFVAVIIIVATTVGCTFTGAAVQINMIPELLEADKTGGEEKVHCTKKVSENAEYTCELEDGVLTISGTGVINSVDYYLDEVKSLIIEEGITGIGEQVFASFFRLEKAVIPDSVKKIGEQAFYRCEKLDVVELSDENIYIGAEAFEGTPWLDYMKEEVAKKEVDPMVVRQFNQAVRGTLEAMPGLTIIGEEGSLAEAYADRFGLAFRAVKKPEEFSLKEAIYDVYNYGGMELVLYRPGRAGSDAIKCSDIYYADLLSYYLSCYDWKQTDKPDIADSDYRIAVDSVYGNERMVVYEGGTGIAEYFDGEQTTYWQAVPQYEGMTSVAEDIRLEFDKLEVASVIGSSIYSDTNMHAAKGFIRAVYSQNMILLSYGNIYKIRNFELIDFNIIESDAGKSITACFEYAFTPHSSVDVSKLIDRGVKKSDGEYEGRYISRMMFELENMGDDEWRCTGLWQVQ